MKRWKTISRCLAPALLLLLLAGCITVKVNLFEEPAPLEEKVVSGTGRDKVLLLDISGVIFEGRGVLWKVAGVTGPSRIKEELEKAAQDRHIKALVLRINSPGGTVSASDMVYHELLTFKEKQQVPVIACLMGVATSGGYYLAQAADVVVAHPTTITGSIGVLAMKLNLQKLLEKVGVEGELVKSGQWKDFWSPFRPATPEEKKMMQAIIDSFYQGFVDVVTRHRKLPPAEIKRLADGRIFTGVQAQELGLVDRLGYLEDALTLAREQAGLEEARVVMYHRPGSYRPTIYSLALEMDLALSPQFLYLWWPGETF